MDYSKAKKEVQARKKKENFLVLSVGYDLKFVLPYKEGTLLVEALGAAEQLHGRYGDPKRIGEIDRDQISITPMSVEEYERHKIAALLNVTVDEVQQFEKAPQPA